MYFDVVVVGAGISGLTIAEQFASLLGKKVLVIEKRDHIGGNCYDYVDEETGILMNKYGAHLFHTNDEEVYNYVTKFAKWRRWEHKVVGLVDGEYVCIPPNITTVNTLCGENLQTEEEMKVWLEQNQVKYDEITNGEEMAKSRVGPELYEKIFKHYTYKQWNKLPGELRPEVLARIPLRTNFDTRYFTDKYQILPEKGYTDFFQKMIVSNDNIHVRLNTDFMDMKHSLKGQTVIFTGPIDAYFPEMKKLKYRSIKFEKFRLRKMAFYQPNSVVNYPGADKEHTRCVEYKHFLNQDSPHTVIVKESTTDEGDPYYPILTDENLALYQKYKERAEKETRENDVHFLGRLAQYKYFNMDQAVRNALDYFKDHFL